MAHRLERGRGSKSPRITFGDSASEGTDVTFIKSRRVLVVGGWFNHMVGISPEEISLGEFCRLLGITVDDVRVALDHP